MSRPPVAETLPSSRSALARIAVVLPAWQPGMPLVHLAEALVLAGFRHLIVVDDGSSPACRPVFQQLARMPAVTLCRHTENCGKGRALKTAFARVLRDSPLITGVVTADADGQHTAADIVRVARRLAGSPDRVVLGVRDFAGSVPWRSRAGNALTRGLFALLSGCRLRDTQTGLRGLPRRLLHTLGQLPGERYEYEMIMLASLCRQGAALAQLPIQTVYLEGNASSHFRPLRDSFRVYGALVRFYGAALRRGQPGVEPDKARLRTA